MRQSQKALLLEKRVKVQSLWRLGGEGEKKSGANLEFKILQAIEIVKDILCVKPPAHS